MIGTRADVIAAFGRIPGAIDVTLVDRPNEVEIHLKVSGKEGALSTYGAIYATAREHISVGVSWMVRLETPTWTHVVKPTSITIDTETCSVQPGKFDQVAYNAWVEALGEFKPSLADHIIEPAYSLKSVADRVLGTNCPKKWRYGQPYRFPNAPPKLCIDPAVMVNGHKVDSWLLDTYQPPSLYDRLDSAEASFLPAPPIPYLPPSNFKCLNLGCPDRAPRPIRETCYTCGKPMEKIS